MTARFWPRPSETLVQQIMKTVQLDRAEATAMAIGMIIAQLIMAAEMSMPSLFGEARTVA